MEPTDLIGTAEQLLRGRGVGRPRQSDLKRAISTAYYAMFHALCNIVADCLVGTAGADRSEPAWRQAYRCVEHGFSVTQCENKRVMSRFPREVQFFAGVYVELQEKRYEADYNPTSRFNLYDAHEWTRRVVNAIAEIAKSPLKDRRAFAVWVAMKHRRGGYS